MILAVAPPISAWWILPFALVLLSVALCPLLYKRWWESNYAILIVVLATIGSLRYVFGGPPGLWFDGMSDYVSFILLMGSLYVVSGGIVVRINRPATPIGNCALLLIGCVLANFLGTTGAAILLIRPYLRANRSRLRPYHIVFFIFLIANIGGSLTPIGDTPLFLGYLMGVPFWFLVYNYRWLYSLTIVPLILIFFIMERQNPLPAESFEPNSRNGWIVQVLGLQNFLLIGLVVIAVFRPGFESIISDMMHHGPTWVEGGRFVMCREMLMVWAALLSWFFTPTRLHHENQFKFAPMREVAIVFLGIFATMVPVVEYLQAHVDQVPLHTPVQFYFSGGVISAVLDSAPAYKILLDTKLSQRSSRQLTEARQWMKRMNAQGSVAPKASMPPGSIKDALAAGRKFHPREFLSNRVSDEQLGVWFLLGSVKGRLLLLALSAGTVLFGACTYLGNGPNLMVKSIADDFGAPSPNFVRYITDYTLPILVPMYLVIGLLFYLIQ